ncbi:MAG: tetratricopeptide repeat protein [Solirubrobacterales bacterium]
MSSEASDDRRIRAARATAAGSQAFSAGNNDEAAAHFGVAALLTPDAAQAHNNLGVALRKGGRVEAAVACYRRGLALDQRDPALYSNMGNALRELGHLEEGEAMLRRAVELAPDNRSFYYNLALLLRDLRRIPESSAMLEELLAEAPENGDYAWDLALTRLHQCDYVRGFEGYEARWRLTRSPPRKFPGTRLERGMDVKGKRVFLHSEQGFGDALQFARFVPMLAAQGAKIILECMPELIELFGTLPGVTAVVEKHARPPEYDLWAPMLSLAHILGTTWDNLPAEVPYLTSPRRLVRPLDKPPGSRLKVGLVWAGKTTPRDRSWPLDRLLPLFTDPRVAFYSLQMGPRTGDLATLGVDRLLRDLGGQVKSFADTAAVMSDLDLIITIDTSVAHLAGALGRPVWVLLRYVSDWRWLDEPEDCAWYPTMRLFRQADPFDVDGPVARMAAALKDLADATPA